MLLPLFHQCLMTLGMNLLFTIHKLVLTNIRNDARYKLWDGNNVREFLRIALLVWKGFVAPELIEIWYVFNQQCSIYSVRNLSTA